MRLILIILLFLLNINAISCAHTLKEIFRDKDYFDKKIVTIEGELVGDIIKKQGGVIVNLKEGHQFIGLYIPYSLASKINYTRKYLTIGDRVRIKGIFNKECPLHFGEQDIHVQELEVVRKGKKLKETVVFPKKITALLLSIITLILGVFYLTTKRYGR